MVKTGVFGGTFDPVHLGHIAVAEAAMESLGLVGVIFIPAGRPVFKSARQVTAAEHRLNMLRLAVAYRPVFDVSAMEIERPGPSYTVDTVTELRRRMADGDEIYFIIGCDGLASLPEWREPARLLELCRLAAAPRPGCGRLNLDALEAGIPGIRQRVVLLEGPHIDISASDIRERAAQGLSLRGLVPDAVADYIVEHKLYRANLEV